MTIKINWRGEDVEVGLGKGKPLSDPPKTYTKLCTVYHNIGNSYNPHTLNIYKNSRNQLRYEIYRDGCFYPYYGKLTTDKDLEKSILCL
ncbi:MAG: hypothetical protein EOL97_08555 [Spirochaetia bacterium]|nr:hypothetical protein [Spirochaetia bacterium]